MTAPIRVLTCALLLAGIVGSAAAQFPKEPPAPMPLAKLGFPPFREAKLSNGLTIVLVENHRLPIVSIQLTMPTGAVHDPAGKAGVAGMVSDVLTKGTASRSADEIAAAIEGVGGSLTANAGEDFFAVGSTVLADGVELAFTLLGDVVLNATYPDAEIDLTRRRLLSALEVERSDPGALGSRFFAATLYGDHPYGIQATPASVRAATPDDIRTFAATNLKPDGALLVVAGDITLGQVRQLAERHLGAWRGKVPARSYGRPPLPRPTEIVLVHRPGSEQANIVVGNLGLPRSSDIYYAATLANRVLGGGSEARLFNILREERGWTYGAYSSISRRFDVGPFQASAQVRTPVADSALREILLQLHRLRDEVVPDEELAAAKDYLTGVFPLSIETPQQVAGQVAVQKRLGLPNDYLTSYRDRIAAVSAGEAQAAARRFIHPDSAVIVVVGDGTALYEVLSPIAPVRIVDTEGKALAAADLTAGATAVVLDPTQLGARRDSMQIVVQGNPMGTQTVAFSVEGDALVMVERTAIPLMGMTQESRVVMDGATLALRSVDQTGQAGPQSAETHLVVDGGRISGTAQTPRPGGQPTTTQVDTVLAEGAIESNQLPAVIPALPLAEGASFTISVLDASEGTIKPYSIRVEAGDPVTVPAGTFEVFKVSVTGGSVPSVFHVTRTAPRRTVKIEVVGQPFVLELVQ